MVHQDRINSAVFSPDGKTVLTASSDRTARLWDPATGRPVGGAMVHQGPVKTAAFSPDGTTVLTGCNEKTVRLWNAATRQPLGKPMVHQGEVESVTFSPDGKSVLTVSWGEDRKLEGQDGAALGRRSLPARRSALGSSRGDQYGGIQPRWSHRSHGKPRPYGAVMGCHHWAIPRTSPHT